MINKRNNLMKDDFSVDLSKFSIDDFKNFIRKTNLLPGRMILKNNLDNNIEQIKKAGINNLKQLISSISNKTKLKEFKRQTGMDDDYIKILKREINSYKSKPINLDKYQDIDPDLINKLKSAGIKTSKDLFNISKDKNDINNLVEKNSIDKKSLNKLICLADLTRITGIGPVFALILYDIGIKSVMDFYNTSAEKILENYDKIIENGSYTNVKLGLNDIDYCKRFVERLI